MARLTETKAFRASQRHRTSVPLIRFAAPRGAHCYRPAEKERWYRWVLHDTSPVRPRGFKGQSQARQGAQSPKATRWRLRDVVQDGAGHVAAVAMEVAPPLALRHPRQHAQVVRPSSSSSSRRPLVCATLAVHTTWLRLSRTRRYGGRVFSDISKACRAVDPWQALYVDQHAVEVRARP